MDKNEPDRVIYSIANHTLKQLYLGTTNGPPAERLAEQRADPPEAQEKKGWDWDKHDIELVEHTGKLTAAMAVSFAHEIETGSKPQFLNQNLPATDSLHASGYIFLQTDAGM